VKQVAKVTFSWDYNTWCRGYLCGEYGHIGPNCVRTHFRKRDPVARCFVCNEHGHIAKNCMNVERIEDEKKARVDEIRKEMKSKWIKKTLDHLD
jgi:hypothetical protein